MKFVIFLIVLYVGGAVNDQVHGIAEVEALLKAVTQHSWTDDEVPCRDAVLSMLHGVQNSTLWATWMWDAMQRPMGTLYASQFQLGNYDQCLNPPWKNTPQQPQYCLLELQLYEGNLDKPRIFDPYEKTADYIKTKSSFGRPMNRMIWGMCLPSQCSASLVPTLAKFMARGSHLATIGEPGIHVHYCQPPRENRSYGFGARMFLIMVLCFVGCAIFFTYYGQQKQINKSFMSEISKSFCLRTNYAELFDEKPNEMSALNGIRFLTAFLVVWAHIFLFIFGICIVNGLDIDKDLASFNGILLLHMDLIVDTFFALSGLLHIKSLLSAKHSQSFIKIIFKRYVRLAVALAVVVFYMAAVSSEVDTGPLWHIYAGGEQSICARTWWKCLLMHTTNIKDMCYIISWYVPCDFQLTILSTIMFFIYKKDKRNGFKLFGIFSILSIIIPGFITCWYKLNGLTTANLQDFLNLRLIENVDYIYVNSYTRAGAYLVGVAMGYLMTVYKPENYKNVIPKMWSFLGTLLAVSIMILLSSLGAVHAVAEFSPIMAITVPMDRILWALAVCSIIGFCVYGDLPLINDFLGWSFFRPLGRLSYGIYMCHSLVLQRYIFSTRSPFKYDHFAFLIVALGVTVITSIASLFLWLFIEAPVINTINYLLRNKAPSIEQTPENNIPNKNGIKKVL